MDSAAQKTAKQGALHTDPRDIMKLYIYGYFNRIRSSRKLMKECTRNVELFYLLGKLVPDFRTVADFRKNNAQAIAKVFRAFTKLCLAYNLTRAINMAGVKRLIEEM